jgi:glycoside/pentoside/hexuronide:cation symporter, GPH family
MRGSSVATKNSSNGISRGMKIGYGVGDFAFNLAYQTTALFLIYFFTDVFGISAAVAGSIFLVSKLWDAVSDPIMGVVSDHTRSRWGSKRPYLLFGAIPLGISFFMLFASPDIPHDMKAAYGYFAFILFCTAITVVNIPYGALTASLTLDIDERANISGYRMSFAMIGTLFTAAVTKILVGQFADETTGFRIMGIIYGILMAVIVLVTFASVKEKVVHRDERAQPFMRNIRLVFINKPFMILAGATILFMVGVNMLAAIVNYYFKYNLKAEKLIPVAFVCLFVTAVLLIPFFVFLSTRKSKKFAYLVGMGSLSATLVALFFLGESSLTVTIVIFILAGVGMSTNFLSPWAMIPDTVEYSEWKTGLRREGVIYGFFFFAFKLGAAIAGFLTGLGLDLAGYVANAEQSSQSLMGIRLMISLVPTLFLLAGMFLVSFYPIDAKMHRMMVQEIGKRS